VPDFAIARSRVRLLPEAAVYQRQLSVPSLQGRLMSTSKSRGVNGHTTQCTSPISVVLQLRLVSGWGLHETEISTALWALEAPERTLLYCTSYTKRQPAYQHCLINSLSPSGPVDGTGRCRQLVPTPQITADESTSLYGISCVNISHNTTPNDLQWPHQ